jgi:hypothetical protein
MALVYYKGEATKCIGNIVAENYPNEMIPSEFRPCLA